MFRRKKKEKRIQRGNGSRDAWWWTLDRTWPVGALLCPALPCSPIKRTAPWGASSPQDTAARHSPTPLPQVLSPPFTVQSEGQRAPRSGLAAMAIPLLLLLLLAMSSGSDGAFCVCKNGVTQQAMQAAIDYACWRGADCTQIAPSGPCFSPPSVQAHCSYATNSYFQKNSPIGATCDFAGVATLTGSDPSSGTCKYPATASAVGTGTGTSTGGAGVGAGTGTGTGMGTGAGGAGAGAGTGTGTGTSTGGAGAGAGTGMGGAGTGITQPGSTTTGTPGSALSPPFGGTGAYGPSSMSPDINEAAPATAAGRRLAAVLILAAATALFVLA